MQWRMEMSTCGGWVATESSRKRWSGAGDSEAAPGLPADPAGDGDQRNNQHPHDQRPPDHSHRTGHGVHVGVVAETELGTEAYGTVVVQSFAEPHAERARAACQHHALFRMHPCGSLRTPAVHRVLEVPGGCKAHCGQPYRDPVDVVEHLSRKPPELAVVLLRAASPFLFEKPGQPV